MHELTGVRREQLRHWRKVIPPLARRDGRADDYTFAEVLALAMLATLVEQMGISISRLSGYAGDLFALLAESEDTAALPDRVHLTDSGRLTAGPEPDCEAFATICTAQVLARVRERLAPEQRRQLLLPLGR